MQLFHYHWWTNEVEEMEKFYQQLGFDVTLRLGKTGATMQTFNPPLSWVDFRHEEIAFRTIEQRKGQTNITFGAGKKNIFDHIGFLVDEQEYDSILNHATILNWHINEGDKRTFISTPWRFRVELQKNRSYVTEMNDTEITKMSIKMPFSSHQPELLGLLLGCKNNKKSDDEIVVFEDSWEISLCRDALLSLEAVHFNRSSGQVYIDPAGTRLYL